MYRITWQRDIKVSKSTGRVIKKDRRLKRFHDFLLCLGYCLLGCILLHPSPPFSISRMTHMRNEGRGTRRMLDTIGVKTPELFNIHEDFIIEELMDEDIYSLLKRCDSEVCERIGYHIGFTTGRMHSRGLAFTDNKAQNYLMKDGEIHRTDLSLIQRRDDMFIHSLDIGSFLASIMDLDSFFEVQKGFCEGYTAAARRRIPVTAFVLRNLLSLVFTPDYFKTASRMLVNVEDHV